MNKKVLIVINSILFCIALAIIAPLIIKSFISPNDREGYIPVELDGFSIEALSDEQVTQIYDCYRAYRSGDTRRGNTSGVSDRRIEEYDADSVDYHAKKLNGIKTVSVTLAEDCLLSIDIDSEVSAGKAAIAIIMDGELLEIVKDETTFKRQYSVEGKHTFRIKLLCENSELEISIKRSLEK